MCGKNNNITTMSNPNPSYKIPKGVSGNPKGRPKREWTWAGLIEQQMEKLGPDKKAVKDAVAASLVAKALEGDVVAIKEIGNRIDGMPVQKNEHSGKLEIIPLMEIDEIRKDDGDQKAIDPKKED